MSKNYSYFSRLKPQKRKVERMQDRTSDLPIARIKAREVQTQLEPVPVLAAIGPSSEF